MINSMWLGTELYTGSYGVDYRYKDFERIINHSIDIGIDKVDTAECYGEDTQIEIFLGKALFGKRDKVEIATKFGHKFVGSKKIEAFDLESIKKQFDQSIQNLKTDYIDIYYFHSGENNDFFNDQIWKYLNELKDSGCIKRLGLSLKHSLVIDSDYQQLEYAEAFGIDVVQTVLNIFSNKSLDYVVPFCFENDIRIIARMPLAKGLLSGKYAQDHIFSHSDDRSNSVEINNKILNNNRDISVEEAIAWCKKRISEVVIGSKNTHQLNQNYSLINQ